MNKEAKNVRHEVYPTPEHRFSNAKVGMTYHDSKPEFPPLDKAPPQAPNVVIVLLDVAPADPCRQRARPFDQGFRYTQSR